MEPQLSFYLLFRLFKNFSPMALCKISVSVCQFATSDHMPGKCLGVKKLLQTHSSITVALLLFSKEPCCPWEQKKEWTLTLFFLLLLNWNWSVVVLLVVGSFSLDAVSRVAGSVLVPPESKALPTSLPHPFLNQLQYLSYRGRCSQFLDSSPEQVARGSFSGVGCPCGPHGPAALPWTP